MKRTLLKTKIGFVRLHGVAVMIAISTLCGSSNAQNTEREKPIPANFVFAMPEYWFLLPGKSEVDNALIFRRYSVVMQKRDFDELRSGATDKIHIIGQVGQFYNSMLYFCQHDGNKADFVQFHMPSDISPASFKYNERVSSLEVRVCTDSGSTRGQGEYMKGDLFIDVDSTAFLDLLFSSELTVEFGNQKDRLNLFIGDKLAKFDLKDVVLTLLPLMLNLKSLQHFGNTEMNERCLEYKKSHRQ